MSYCLLLEAERLLFSSLLFDRLPGLGIPDPGVGILEPLEARLRLLVEVLFLAALRFLLDAPAILDEEGGAAILDPGIALPGPVGEVVFVRLLAMLLDEDDEAELLAVGIPLWLLWDDISLAPEPFCKLIKRSSAFSFFKPNDFLEAFFSSMPPIAPASGGRALAP